MILPEPPKIIVELLDLTRQIRIYDDSPEDWNTPVQMSIGLSIWSFSLAEIDRQNFSQLEEILGAENFNTIVETQGFAHPSYEFKIYRGEDNLPLRYSLRASQYPNIHELVIISFGEFQPNRWIAHVEGTWHVSGVTMNGKCGSF